MQFQFVQLVACTLAFSSHAQVVRFYYDNAGNQVLSLYEGALPVRLIHFNALRMENSVELDWQTSAEIGSDHFAIERSKDGKTWREVGSVKANVISDSRKYYYWRDEDPMTGSNYYRLRMVDLNGTFEYTETRNVFIKGEFEFWPNPVTEQFNIKGIIGSFDLDFFLTDGRKMLNMTKIVSGAPIGTTGLIPGMYLVRLTEAGGRTISFRIVKE